MELVGLEPTTSWVRSRRREVDRSAVLDNRGASRVRVPRSEIEKYRFVNISRELVDSQTVRSGTSVLRGRLSAIRNATPQQGQAAPVSNAVLCPPRS
jgi:hypothetical protein